MTGAIPLLLHGATGRMGTAVRSLLPSRSGIALRACVASEGPSGECPPGCAWIGAGALDVSLPEGTAALVTLLERAPRAAVVATTGLPESLEARLAALARRAPILRARNLSLGVAVMRAWIRDLPAPVREAFVADVVEQHHAGKKDAPSGTALDLAAALGPMGETRRPGGMVHTHAIRAGSVPGTHRVILSGDGETLELLHTVYDRSVFAAGALRAVGFVHGRAPGLYSIDDLVAASHDTKTSRKDS
ncbi:MAG TPA: dihydrodipicolinate reductase C-terminal domain-containing protein [Candidatus Eisenbacteria bacterium]|nr:dihydrodipicolinate reductase C-terminal domain-containing protein [Candidatus Eisenbacteria bacterium]